MRTNEAANPRKSREKRLSLIASAYILDKDRAVAEVSIVLGGGEQAQP
jgi:hypothetical protein